MSQISVIVPVYKVEAYLHRCVDSILVQTFADFDLILIDDGSPDKCGMICDEYTRKDQRIHVIHQSNRGLSAARNAGIEWAINSNSSYISFIDSDDWIHPRFLELLYFALLENNANISQCSHINTNGTIESPFISEETICVSPEEQFTHYYSGIICEKLYRKEVFQSVRFPVGRIHEDTAVWYKILFAESKIAIVNSELYYYFINPESIVRKEWTPPRFDGIISWDQMISFLINYGNKEVLQSALRRYYRAVKKNYYQIEESSKISVPQKKYYQSRISRRVRRLLHKYGWAFSESGEQNELYALAYPESKKIYWTWIGIKNKIRKVLHLR